MLIQALREVTNLFLQQSCPLCDRPTPQALCPDCWRQISCQQHQQPAVSATEALPVLSLGPYQGHLKQALSALKYDHHRQLAYPLGKALGQHWQLFPIPTRTPPVVVPIPLHADKLQERGFNQAALLAAAFCQQTGLRLQTHGLIRQRATAPQFGLGAAEREKNMADAFTLGPVFHSGKPQGCVLFIDDIYTTGTTVRSAARVLRRHGISVCGVAAIAQAVLEH